jgi:hypothetical protein
MLVLPILCLTVVHPGTQLSIDSALSFMLLRPVPFSRDPVMLQGAANTLLQLGVCGALGP